MTARAPAVVGLNGVVSSLAVKMEWMVWTTGLRQPRALPEYRVGIAPQQNSFPDVVMHRCCTPVLRY